MLLSLHCSSVTGFYSRWLFRPWRTNFIFETLSQQASLHFMSHQKWFPQDACGYQLMACPREETRMTKLYPLLHVQWCSKSNSPGTGMAWYNTIQSLDPMYEWRQAGKLIRRHLLDGGVGGRGWEMMQGWKGRLKQALSIEEWWVYCNFLLNK